jgi:(2R)-sulfolactate sulfo-lyase subunit alpha
MCGILGTLSVFHCTPYHIFTFNYKSLNSHKVFGIIFAEGNQPNDRLNYRHNKKQEKLLFIYSIVFKLSKEACMAIDFLVHEAADGVGVVVVEGLTAGQDITGWVMKEDKTITVKIISDIPIGHKLALKDYAKGDTVIKYNTDIGKVVAPIKKGEHLHVHNVKTKRW